MQKYIDIYHILTVWINEQLHKILDLHHRDAENDSDSVLSGDVIVCEMKLSVTCLVCDVCLFVCLTVVVFSYLQYGWMHTVRFGTGTDQFLVIRKKETFYTSKEKKQHLEPAAQNTSGILLKYHSFSLAKVVAQNV